jgi:hypothetical protein
MSKLLIMVCVILIGSSVYIIYLLSSNDLGDLNICNSDIDIVI